MSDNPVTPIASKPWYQSKTMWLNFVAIIGVVATYASGHLGTNETIGSVLFGASNLVLRSVTSQPIAIK